MTKNLVGYLRLSRAKRAAPAVDLEVILAADVSRSIDDAEFDLQRKGYAAALTDPRVVVGFEAGWPNLPSPD